MFGLRYLNLTILLICVLLGCSAGALQKYSFETPAQILNPIGLPAVKDGRAQFREIFCGLINENPEAQQRQINCEDYLWRLSDEKQDEGKNGLIRLGSRICPSACPGPAL